MRNVIKSSSFYEKIPVGMKAPTLKEDLVFAKAKFQADQQKDQSNHKVQQLKRQKY